MLETAAKHFHIKYTPDYKWVETTSFQININSTRVTTVFDNQKATELAGYLNGLKSPFFAFFS